MTYDNAEEIRQLAQEFGFKTALVAMKNTHHEIMNELLVGKNLAWLKDWQAGSLEQPILPGA